MCQSNECVWCGSAIRGAAEFVGGRPMHQSCVDEYFGEEDTEDCFAESAEAEYLGEHGVTDWDGRMDEELEAMQREYVPSDDYIGPDEYVWDCDFGHDG